MTQPKPHAGYPEKQLAAGAERPMAQVRTVIFDLGGVLLDWRPAQVLARCYPEAATQERVREALFRHEDWRTFNRGECSEAELLERVSRRHDLSVTDLERVMTAVRDSLVELPDTVAYLEELHAEGVPLYCLSDMPVPVFAHVRQRGTFWNAFRGIVVSGEVRMLKPSHEIFNHILSRYALAPESTAFIDDHPPNIEGARRAGIHAILFTDVAQCREAVDAWRAGPSQRA